MERLVFEGFGFYYTDCTHEVPFILQSFHRTKAGAYAAMRKRLVEDWEKERALYVADRCDEWKRTCQHGAKHLEGTAYRVRPHTFTIED